MERPAQVYVAYGSVMHVVQYWENAIGLLWWRATREERTRPVGDFDTQAAQKELRRFETAFQKITVQKALKQTIPHLTTEAAQPLLDLMRERDRFAHRLLFERQDEDGFKPGTLAELGDLGSRFDASVRAMEN